MPAKKNQDVMDMVREQLEKDPDVETATLFDKAKDMDSSLEDLSLRQFHARYPLQVKRKLSSARKAAKGGGKKSGKKGAAAKKAASKARGSAAPGEDGREAIREGLLRFAKDVASADSKADLITVLTSVDDYVEDVSSALEKA